MPRAVSLLPSVTEMLCALGHGDQLVARSHACDFPASVLQVPSCTEPKAPLPGIGYGLHERLKALVQEGLSPHRVDAQLLRDLRPDVIFTRFDLPFAGIRPSDIEKAVHDWFGHPVQLVPMDMLRIADIWPAFRDIATAMGAPEEGVRVAMQIQQRMAAIVSQAAACSQRPRVTCLSGLEPLTVSQGMLPELVEMAGAKHFPSGSQMKPEIGWDTLHEINPDIILLMPHSKEKGRVYETVARWEGRDEWRALPAVQSGNVALCLSSALCSRLGPRVAEALEAVAEIVHPDEFQFGHRGHSWEPL